MPADPPSPELIDALLTDIAPLLLLAWLDTQPYGHGILRGFQQTPKTLRLAPVRKRFKDVLQNHPDAAQSLIDCWKLGNDKLLDEVHALSDKKLRAGLQELQEKHGERTVHLSLMLDGREKVLLQPATAKPQKSTKKSTSKTSKKEAQNPLIEELRADIKEKENRLTQTEEALRSSRQETDAAIKSFKEQQHQAEIREQKFTRDLKRETTRAAKAEELLEEKTRLANRSERRAKKLQQEQEAAELEIKRLRRQVRQQQQIAEDLRKQLATITPQKTNEEAKVLSSDATPQTGEATSTPQRKKILNPADQQFLFEVAGHRFQISARQLAQAVERNDEDMVFSLTQALFTLREINPAGHKMFLERVRTFDRYSARVLTGDTTRVLVDASNVARFEKNKYGKGILENLLALRDELRSRSYFPIILIADASLPHFIDQPQEFKKLVQQDIIQITNKGEEADEYLTRMAQKSGAFVVTNDVNFHLKTAPDFDPLRIGFTISHGAVFLHEF